MLRWLGEVVFRCFDGRASLQTISNHPHRHCTCCLLLQELGTLFTCKITVYFTFSPAVHTSGDLMIIAFETRAQLEVDLFLATLGYIVRLHIFVQIHGTSTFLKQAFKLPKHSTFDTPSLAGVCLCAQHLLH